MRGDWKDQAMQYRDLDRAVQQGCEQALFNEAQRKIDAYPKLVAALRAISEAQEVSGDSFVCDFSTLQSIAGHALRDLGE